MDSPWLAAAAATVVTPPTGLGMGGYAARHGVSTGVLDDLEVNVLTLRGPRRPRLAWIAVDALAVTAPLRAALTTAVAHATGIDERHMVVLASHTHSAPVGWVGTILPSLPAASDPGLLSRLYDDVSGIALVEAPVTVEYSCTDIPGIAANRQRKDGPADASAGVVTVYDTDHRPLAVLYDFACHPTVLGPENMRWSADWVGAARRELRRQLGTELPVVFAQGAAGDVSTRLVRQGRRPEDVMRIGGAVADRLLATLPHARLLSPGDLRMVRRDLTVPSRWDDGSRLTASVSVVRTGGLRLLAIPAELVANLGRRLTTAFPGIRLYCCADGYLGYLADEESHSENRYEAANSPLTLPETLSFLDFCAELVAAS
ncbi:MAG: hypothetical protein BGO26_00660 [Actinobacteria bacterium 69-20]|jgi:hypothetical protein|nr:hypothetical protein [Actinomycetota bacterium]OJV28525.1 MAG: hypothetical protein BGO26_00660 [Actinobacteria bacterium 69-20]